MAHENATPRPWTFSHGLRRILGALDDDGCHPQVAEGISKRISESDPRAVQFKRDAALIVEAVNAYDTLQSGIEAAVSETNRVRAAYDTLRAENERLASKVSDLEADLHDEETRVRHYRELSEVLRAACREAQASLAMLTEPEEIRSTSVTHAWAQAVAAEQRCRAALSEAQP